MPKATLYVSYSQIAVFDPSLDRPFNDWATRHVGQGFAWRSGSVSFATLEEAGEHEIDVLLPGNGMTTSASTIRAIQVPFEVPAGGIVSVASISDELSVQVPPGSYGLRYEAMPGRIIRLMFIRDADPEFRIVKADAGLCPTYPLLTTAEPA